MSIDRENLIEAAARAEWATAWPGVPVLPWVDQAEGFKAGVAAALPVIVAAVTDEVRKLHTNRCASPYCDGGACHECIKPYPCPTKRLLDEIDAAAGREADQ